MKKILVVVALASTLALAGCGKKATSSSSADTTSSSESASASNSTSTSASNSTSTSASSDSTPTPVDPEAAYKVTETEFLDYFLNQLDNCTLDCTYSSYYTAYKRLYSGKYLSVAYASGYADYYRIDDKGVFNGMQVNESGAHTRDYQAYQIATSSTSYYQIACADVLYWEFGFTTMSQLYADDLNFDAPLLSMPQSHMEQYLKTLYGTLTYDATTHSYTTPSCRNSYYYDVTSHLYFNNKTIEKALVETEYSTDSITETVVPSALGTTKVELSSTFESYMPYYHVRWLDSDKTTVLASMPASLFNNGIVYAGSFRHTPEDDQGAYQLTGFTVVGGDGTVKNGKTFYALAGDTDLVVVWTKLTNDQLYTFDTATNTLTYNGTENVGSLKIPATYSVSGTSYPVEHLVLSKITNQLTSIALPSSLISLSKGTSSQNDFSQIEFTVDANSTYFAVKDGALLDIANHSLIARYVNDPATSYTVPKDIVSIGELAFTNSRLESVDLSLTSIDALSMGAFYNATRLKTVNLPATLATIGDYCFDNCLALTTIDLTNVTGFGYYALAYTHSLKNVTFSSSLSYIEKYGFEDSDLVSVSLPASLTYLGEYAFDNCYRLESVTIPSSISSTILSEAGIFSHCKVMTKCVLPDTITALGNYCFSYCAKYAFNIPSKLATIGQFAFAKSLGAESLVLPSTITSIGSSAFTGVSALKSASLADTTLTSLPESCFSYCANLTSVTLPSTMTSLSSLSLAYTGLTTFTLGEKMTFASNTFAGDDSLAVTSLNPDFVFDAAGHFYFDSGSTTLKGYLGAPTTFTAPATLTNVNERALKDSAALTKLDFSNVTSAGLTFGDKSFADCSNLTDIVWPTSTMTTLGTSCFLGAGITNLTLPSNVNIDNVTSPFYGCPNLTSADLSAATGTTMGSAFLAVCSKLSEVKLPTSLTTIGQTAFSGDTALKSLVIPSSVTTIGAYNFQSCSADLKLYLEATTLPSGYTSGWNAINDSTNAECLLYSETEPDYTTAGTQRYWHYDTNKKPVIWVQA